MKFSLFLVTFLLGVVISSADNFGADDQTSLSDIDDQISLQSKTWCVVKPGAPAADLQVFIDSQCSRIGCPAIQAGGSCYEPNTVQNHASYVLDLVFRKTGACNAQFGLPAVTDPSFGKCQFP